MLVTTENDGVADPTPVILSGGSVAWATEERSRRTPIAPVKLGLATGVLQLHLPKIGAGFDSTA